jgi:DNA helicase HerA-like ATPase
MVRSVTYGGSGKGKSWYLQYLIENSTPEFDHAVIFDVEGEFTGMTSDGFYKSLYVDKEILQKFSEPHYVALVKRNKYVRIEPDGLTRTEQRELFATIARAVVDEDNQWGFKDENCFVAIDEMHLIAPQGAKKDETYEAISRLATGGRKYGIEWCGSTQRVAKLDKDVVSQVDYGITFGVRDTDLDRVADLMGVDKDTIEGLPKRRCVIKNFDTGDHNVIDTNTLSMEHPHIAKDASRADSVFDGQING